eukprot:5654295-Pyramimonas_sp.AAC.1
MRVANSEGTWRRWNALFIVRATQSYQVRVDAGHGPLDGELGVVEHVRKRQFNGVRQNHRHTPAGCRVLGLRGVWGDVWSSEDAQGPQHRLQTPNQVAQYIKGVQGLPSDYRLSTTVLFKIPRS